MNMLVQLCLVLYCDAAMDCLKWPGAQKGQPESYLWKNIPEGILEVTVRKADGLKRTTKKRELSVTITPLWTEVDMAPSLKSGRNVSDSERSCTWDGPQGGNGATNYGRFFFPGGARIVSANNVGFSATLLSKGEMRVGQAISGDQLVNLASKPSRSTGSVKFFLYCKGKASGRVRVDVRFLPASSTTVRWHYSWPDMFQSYLSGERNSLSMLDKPENQGKEFDAPLGTRKRSNADAEFVATDTFSQSIADNTEKERHAESREKLASANLERIKSMCMMSCAHLSRMQGLMQEKCNDLQGKFQSAIEPLRMPANFEKMAKDLQETQLHLRLQKSSLRQDSDGFVLNTGIKAIDDQQASDDLQRDVMERNLIIALESAVSKIKLQTATSKQSVSETYFELNAEWSMTAKRRPWYITAILTITALIALNWAALLMQDSGIESFLPRQMLDFLT